MGNSQTNHFPVETWNFDHRNDFYDIYRSSRGTFAEKHIIPNNPKIEPKDQMEVYNYRHKTHKPIVHIYDADYEKAENTCGKQKNINVYSQYIPHRLSDTVNLTHGQALYVMSEALYGFEELNYRFGGFPITDDHIGFNDQGQVRVWHSPNFGSNHLPRDGILLMSTKNPRRFDERIEKKQQQQMVEDIWLAVNEHSNMRRDFVERARMFRDMDFMEARKFVADEIDFAKDYVPQYLNFRDAIHGRHSHNSGNSYGHRGGHYQNNYRDQYREDHYYRGNMRDDYREGHRGRFTHSSNDIINPTYQGSHHDSRAYQYGDQMEMRGSRYNRQSPNFSDQGHYERREFRNSRYRESEGFNNRQPIYGGTQVQSHYHEGLNGRSLQPESKTDY